jgi:PKD repeat protein
MSSGSGVKEKQLWLFTIIIISTFFGNAYAKTVTINPDSAVSTGERYQTLDACLTYIGGGQDVDTILFTESTQHKYNMSVYLHDSIGSLYLIGSSTDPNNYPILNDSGNSFYNFIEKNGIYFERLIITGDTSFDNGMSNSMVSFKQCVIRNYTHKFFIFSGGISPTIDFENCLFTNNTDTLFRFNYWESGTPKLTITNCTFDSCNAIFSPGSETHIDGFSITNSIFTNITVPINANITAKITNSLFDQIITTTLGTGCIPNVDPKYVSSARIIPSDWKLQVSSPALRKVDTLNAPKRDLGNQLRSIGGTADLGCWEMENQPPSNIILSNNTIAEHMPIGTQVGLFTATDPDANQTFTYSFVADTGSTNNALFTITGNLLKTAADIAYSTQNLSIRIQVADQSGDTFQKVFSISIATFPKITLQPQNDTILSGQPALFSITASGQAIAYQWTKNNVAIAAQTTDTLKLLNVQQADSGTFYKCIITNLAGSVTSDSARLFVNTPAMITAEPASDTIAEGDSTTFALTAKGSGTLTYIWFRNGVAIPASNAASIKISAVTKFTDSGSVYKCAVSNIYGSDTSLNVYLHVIRAKPVILTEPVDVTVEDFKDAIFTLKAWGSTPLKYAWFSTKSTDTLSHKDTLSLIGVVKSKDSGSTYFCVVSNDVGVDTSNSVQLHVGTVKPIITIQPDSQSVYETTIARFFIQATGSTPLTFKWYKKGLIDSLKGTDNDTLLLPNVLRSDSGAYYCIVSNAAGTETSKQAILKVAKALAKPAITFQLPKAVLKYTGDSLILVIKATGNPTPVFQWVKNDTIAAGKNDSVLVVKSLSLNDNNSRFYCIVSNSQDTVFSDTTTLTVESRPKALFSCSPTSGVLPLNVSFSETSTGTITSRTWDFGDGTTSTVASPTHIYTAPGQYSIRLVVTGPGGSDTLFLSNQVYVYEEGANPVQLKAQFLKPSKVIITLSNLANLDVTPPPPIAETLSVWYKTDSLPQLPSTSVLAKVYSTALFNDKKTFGDTITLPTTDSLYGIMNSLTYQNGSLSKFLAGNGSMVLMRDTSTPINSLVISGNYVKGNISSIQLNNLTEIDTSQIDSVGVWYGLDSSKVDFSAPPSLWYASSFLRTRSTGQFAVEVQNSMFIDSAKIWCAVICKGVNGKKSVKNFGSFLTRANIVNPIVLSATALSGGKILLTWNAISDSLFTRICIWKGLSEVPLGTSISDNIYDSIRVPVTTTSYSYVGLNANTTYYFGAQALTKDGVWVAITKDSRTTLNTPVATDSIPNTIDIKTIVFDTVSNKISVTWCLDSINADSLLVGISYSLDGTQNVNAIVPQNVTQLCEGAIVKTPTILFDTTYHVALWLSKLGSGVWAKPTDSSSKTIKTTPFTHQVVTFFEQGKELVTAANGKIQLWTDNLSNMIESTDTLRIYKFKTAPEGFYDLNIGFEFVKKESNHPFFVGLEYSKLPSPYLASQIRMFRLDSLGNVTVEYLSQIDTIKKIVYVKTSDLIAPFVLLIDTAKPKINITETPDIARLGDDITDKLVINDNVNNVKWKYSYSRGDGLNAKADSGFFTKADKSKMLSILHTIGVINVDNGVRINLTVTDGTFSETINCSRRVYRTTSDYSVTSPNKWFPLFVTAKINNPAPESMLVQIKTGDSLYDIRYTRLFRWYPSTPNQTSKEGWIEYSAATSPKFEFTPGKVVWIKTLKTANIDFGAGTTLSLKDTFTIDLLPLNWTDIGLPYHFNMKLDDILKCTQKSDSLRFCKWVKNSDEVFSTSNLYFPTYSNIQWLNKNIELVYENGGGLSVYNPSKDTIKLRIPPTPFSETALSKQASNDKSWSVKISCKTNRNVSLPEIYCGYSQGALEKYYPASPTFIESKIALFDRKSNSMHGLYQTGNITQGGFAKEIAIVNNSDSVATFTLSAEQSGNFPLDYQTSFYNPTSKNYESTSTTTVDAHSTQYRWAITSNGSYLERYFSKNLTLIYSLGVLYPNPCRSVLMIPFTIPLSSSDKIKFEIFDQLGRVVWNKELTSLQAGSQRLLWDGKNKNNTQISAGFYLVRFTSVDSKGKITSRFQKQFTYLP